jgi:hypothetical protein
MAAVLFTAVAVTCPCSGGRWGEAEEDVSDGFGFQQ